jgi:peptide deformylase
MVEIVQKGHPVLRQHAEEVPVEEISSPKIQKILQDMKDALEKQEDGVAIAAPQIGIPLRIFIVSKRVHVLDNEGRLKEPIENAKNYEDSVFINPQILKVSRKKHWVPEGCLSVAGIFGSAFRSKQASVRACNEKGEIFTRGGSGLMAQIFQHEVDHLEGILFCDHARNLQEMEAQE